MASSLQKQSRNNARDFYIKKYIAKINKLKIKEK